MRPAHIAFSILVLLEILLVFQGCHTGGSNPAVPDYKLDTSPAASGPNGSPDAQGPKNIVSATPALWGYYTVIYNASSHDIQAVPQRGPEFAWNVVNFLQPPAGSSKNMVVGVLDDSDFTNQGRIDVRVILHHPFPGQPTYTGFDVCGIFVTEGSQVSVQNPKVTYAKPGVDPELLNADGYTRWMNPTEFLSGDVLGYDPGIWGTSESSENSGFLAGATVNPYKYFAQGLGSSQSLRQFISSSSYVEDRGIFPSGATCSRDYELQFPIVQGQMNFIFNYAVLANWVSPTVTPPTNPKVDFPLEANARYPLHIFATDHSKVYHTPTSSGGTLSFELNVFDWDAALGNSSIPKEISKIVVWSDDPLVPGGSYEQMSDEVEWNSGFTASISTAIIDIENAIPSTDGDAHVWIAIESANPSTYDQGFGAKVPSDPIATYMEVPVNVKNCPKAFLNGINTQEAGIGTILDDVEIHGENFENGDDLAVYLELQEAGGGAGDPQPTRINGTDIKYLDNGHITADFDFHDAPLGHYGCGCVNGCGIETPPDENKIVGKIGNFDVVMPTPIGLTLSTNRNGSSTPSTLDNLYLSWDDVGYDALYKLYVTSYDINGNQAYSGVITGTKYTNYTFTTMGLQITGGGMADIYVTAVGESGNFTWESSPSTTARVYYQNFECAMGQWAMIDENYSYLRFIRSTSGAGFAGYWGIKSYGGFPYYPALWAALVSPPLPDLEGADTVRYEFLHRQKKIALNNGYQVGWCDTVPESGSSTFPGYKPITSTIYGFCYNASHSSALQSEFGVNSNSDQNFQNLLDIWTGWYVSGFDASAMLGDGKSNHLVVGLAGNNLNSGFEMDIDEAAILMY
jgi:hypothetical protein